MSKVIDPALFDVVTIQEACSLFFISEDTCRYHIIRGNFQARLAGEKRGVYLISLASIRAYYARPKSPHTSVQTRAKMYFNT